MLMILFVPLHTFAKDPSQGFKQLFRCYSRECKEIKMSISSLAKLFYIEITLLTNYTV